MDVKNEIRKTHERLRLYNKIINHIESLKVLISEKEKQKVRCNVIIEQKREVVNKYLDKKHGLRTMFSNILGEREMDQEKNKQELLNAVLDYNDLDSELEALRFELEILNKKQNTYHLDEDRLEELYKIRKLELLSGDSKDRIKMIILEKQKNKYKGLLNEIDEAKIHLDHMLNLVSELKETIEKIVVWRKKVDANLLFQHKVTKDWADHAKHSAIHVQIAIDKFQLELKDVWQDRNLDLGLRFKAFDNFIYTLNKNLIIDWVVKKRIDTAYQGIIYILKEAKKIKIELDEYLGQVNRNYKENDKAIYALMAGWTA